MIFSIKKDMVIQLDAATSAVKKMKKDFKDFIEDYEHAIKEINALDDTGPVREMERIVYDNLPGVEADRIVRGGILQFDEEPYGDYVKKISKQYNADKVGKETILRNAEMFLTEQKTYLKGKRLKGDIGQYHFDLLRMDLNVVASTDTTITFHHTNEMQPRLTMHSDKTVHFVDKDEVGLDGFRTDLTDGYVSNLRKLLAKHANRRYIDVIVEHFIVEHHKKLIAKLEDYMRTVVQNKYKEFKD